MSEFRDGARDVSTVRAPSRSARVAAASATRTTNQNVTTTRVFCFFARIIHPWRVVE